jgi:hypothetical protein
MTAVAPFGVVANMHRTTSSMDYTRRLMPLIHTWVGLCRPTRVHPQGIPQEYLTTASNSKHASNESQADIEYKHATNPHMHIKCGKWAVNPTVL